jgi:pimeloyl-ACP methyl ester carboxylesterase
MSLPRVLRPTLSAAVCGVALSLAVSGASAAAQAGDVVDLPASFQVENTNTSALPCPSDGAQYTVRGRLVGPRSALEGPRSRAVTVYLHGFNVGTLMWRLPGFPQLDLPTALAKLGHVSLVLDELGYDTSDHPQGLLACVGSQADITHQIVQELRAGRYTVIDGRGPAFKRVVLAGHDVGAVVADIEAYSYKDIDGLIHLTWADQGFTQTAQTGFANVLPICASGGQPAEQGPPDRDDPAGGPSGYVQFLTDTQIRQNLSDLEPAVVDRLMRLVNRNPCGEFESVLAALQLNTQKLPEIHVPVLYGYGDLEFLWTQDGLAQEAQLFRGSPDLTTAVFHEVGHFPQFSLRFAPIFQSTIANWLHSHGA